MVERWSRAVANLRLLFDVLFGTFDRHAMAGELAGLMHADAVQGDLLRMGGNLRDVERWLSAVVSPASIAGGGEAGAEKRSAPVSPVQHTDVTTRTLARLTREGHALRRDRDRQAEVIEGHESALRLYARRVVTLEDVARIARAALSSGDEMLRAHALRELSATLPDERDGVEASLADQPATPLNPALMVQCAGVATYTTLRAFLDANADDEQVRAAVLALKPGDSVNVGGGASPMVTVTRKAA